MSVQWRAQAPGRSSVIVEELEGRSVIRARITGSSATGAFMASDGEGIDIAARVALTKRKPLLLDLDASGTDPGEGTAALHAWATAAKALTACSGVVPVISTIQSQLHSGPALLAGLSDLTIFTRRSVAFVSGPRMVEQFTGHSITNEVLGGADVHARQSGLAAMVVDSAEYLDQAVSEILAYFPDHCDALSPIIETFDPVDRLTPEAGEILPETSTGAYDIRSIIGVVADDGVITELHEAWAPNLVTALMSIGGQSVGVVANQPQSIAGTLDIAASRKGARFVGLCDAFNLPLVTFVDTSGFYPGKDLEWRGMIRYGAQMAFAYARASVPRVNVTLRKSYGGAYIVMDSKMMGNDIAFAWPSAEIAVMGAKGAVEILHRRADLDERADLEAAYEERLLNPYIAAERGAIDDVIEPAETRSRVSAALSMLRGKREQLSVRHHDNQPL